MRVCALLLKGVGLIGGCFLRKAEMEVRRKVEEEERRRLEEEDIKAAGLLQAELEKQALEESKYRQLLEQERHDHELALRLAQESNGQLEDSPPTIRKYAFFFLSFGCLIFCKYNLGKLQNIELENDLDSKFNGNTKPETSRIYLVR